MVSFLHQQVILYEEEIGTHTGNTGQKLHLAQEKLALAGDKIVSLERSLNLYRDKYQTSLSNIELLECQVKMLEGELSGIVGQVGPKLGLSNQELQRVDKLPSSPLYQPQPPLPETQTFNQMSFLPLNCAALSFEHPAFTSPLRLFLRNFEALNQYKKPPLQIRQKVSYQMSSQICHVLMGVW